MKKSNLAVFLTILCLFQTGISFCQNKPNIIYIMADDLGYADLSSFGRKDYQTPNLDRLASQGVKFMNAYATAPVCTPTRIAFMTGRYPARHEIGIHEPLEWSTRDSLLGLTPDVPSVATLLKRSGYKTYLVGKWHLGFQPAFNPLNNGFDYFFGFHGGAIDFVSHTGGVNRNPDLFENFTPIKREGYATDIWASKAIEIIKNAGSKPFFMAVMFNAPHWPWQGPADPAYHDTMPLRAGGSPQIYAAMMKSLDEAIGSIVKAIDDRKLGQNTLIIFTSDNGGERYSDMGPYKARKMHLWEGGIRVPAVARWPAKLKANKISGQVVHTVDWTATILSAGGANADPTFPLDGVNILPYIAGTKKETERTIYWRISQRREHKAMREGDWKYLRDEKGEEFLVNLKTDPYEKGNVKDKEKAIFESLKKKYALWEASMLKPLPLQTN